MVELTRDASGEASVLIQILDQLAPHLDTYEQALYLHIFRHTYLNGAGETTIGFRSASKRMAFGSGAKGTRIAPGTIYEKLRSLCAKGCVELLDVTRQGTRVRLVLPQAVPGIMNPPAAAEAIDIEAADFFAAPDLRDAIFRRDDWRCGYCRKRLTASNGVLDHIVSRPSGGNSYRNLVAACTRCNNRKGSDRAENYLRKLFREDFLSDDEFTEQLRLIAQTRDGQRVPHIEPSPVPLMMRACRLNKSD